MDNIVLITGGTSGFGESCARIFAQNEWKIIVTGRRRERLESLAKELKQTTPVHTICQDVRDRSSVAESVSSLPKDFADIDVLINNAGLALGLEPAHLTDLDEWETMVATNINGLLYFTRLILPRMVEKNRGHIINIGSVAGNWPYPGGNVYGATKAFVKQFSHNLRADLLGKNIRVTNIEPGLAETEFSIIRFKGDKKQAKKVYKGTQPLTAEDIAEIIYWVATLPPHININSMEIMPTCQSWSPFAIYRKQSDG